MPNRSPAFYKRARPIKLYTYSDPQVEIYRGWAWWLISRDREFTITSMHPSWKGKVKCLYCKATGYGGSVAHNPLWWGQYHGANCYRKGLPL